MTSVKARKNISISDQGSLPTITRKTTPTTNHFQPAPIDKKINHTKIGTSRKDDSDKASIMVKSREVEK